jgi:hypothetical protein
MTLRKSRDETGSQRTPPEHTPRLRLKPKAPASGHVDGAWWPHSDDLAAELPDLLAVLSVRLESIERVVYHPAEWASAAEQLRTPDGVVHLDGNDRRPENTIEVIGTNRGKLVLLVVPARTDPDRAHDVLMSAAAPGDVSSTGTLLDDTSASER